MKRMIILFLMSFHLQAIAEQRTVILENEKDRFYISDNLEYYCDSTKSLTIEKVSSATFSHHFHSGSIPYIEKDYNKDYWLRFTVYNNRNPENQAWYFESWGFDIDNIEFYVPDKKGGFIKTAMGYAHPFAERNIYHKNFEFLLNTEPGERTTYYIKMRRHYPMHLTFFIRTHEAFIKHVVFEYWYLGIFYGIYTLIIFINLFLFFRLKEKLYFYYVLCASSEVLYCLGRDGLGFQFLWPSMPILNTFTHHNLSQFLLIAFTILYSIQFLKLKEVFPFLYKLSIAAIVLKAVMFLFFIWFPIFPPYVFSIDSIILLIPFIAGILSLKKGNRYAKYYVLAFTSLFISFLLIFMDERRIIPYMFVNWYFINIGMLLEVIFLAIAMIDKIKVLRDEKEEADQKIIEELKEKEQLKNKINQKLEKKVSERTDQINKMLVELESRNSQLVNANSELEVLTAKVKEMNELLNKDNEKLKTDITDINQSRILLRYVTIEEFKQAFPDDDSCLKYLAELKWAKGYKCKKCGFNKGVVINKGHSIRCRNCKYNESPTSGTLFHKLKFPLHKAFYLMYLITSTNQTPTLEDLTAILSLRRETCWSFRKKILTAKEEALQKGIIMNEQGWAALVLMPLNQD